MEVIGAIASFIAIGQAISTTPKIISILKSFANASKELAALIDELERLYVLYQHLKDNVDLFSGDHNASLLRIQEPPYLKLIRTDLESLINELQELADSCLVEGGYGPRASKLRWWRKRGDVARLRDECHKQREQLLHLYMLFRDQLTHKQGELLVHIHTRISQQDGHAPLEPEAAPLHDGNRTNEQQNPSAEGAVVAQGGIDPPNQDTTAEDILNRRCRCPCHTLKAPKKNQYSLYVRLPGRGFLEYRSQTVIDNPCGLKCCTAAQSFVAMHFRLPMWLRSLAFTGSLRFGFPLNISMSLTPTTRYSDVYELKLKRVCYLDRPDLLNQWLSYYAGSILSVNDSGRSVLESIIYYGGNSLLAYCMSTWPNLITGTIQGRKAAERARVVLWLDYENDRSASDRFHLTRFIQFMEDEDESSLVIDIAYSENPIQALQEILPHTPSILTIRSVRGYTILHQACITDNVELVKYLLTIGALIDITDDGGRTPLHRAVAQSAWSSAELLVNEGCQVNIFDNYGDTPLLAAAGKIGKNASGAIRFAKFLLSRGADAGAKKTSGSTVWHNISFTNSSHRDDLWELYEMLFAAGGARVIDQADMWGKTPLIQALLDKDALLISFLRKVGARCDGIDQDGWNLLHFVGDLGDSECCQLSEGLEISCIDIRTTDDDGYTPLESWREVRNYYDGASDIPSIYSRGLNWRNVTHDNPGEEIVSQEKSIAFERLLRSIRDRMLIREIEELEAIISKIHAMDLASAKEMLKVIAEGKVKAKIDHEAETFRAIGLDVREGRLELAVESIQEFIEASRDRMRVSPFDEEIDSWASSEASSVNSDDVSEDEGESAVEIGTGDDSGDQGSSEDSDSSDSQEAGYSEDEGWKTADED
ncbi:hypothetical protein EKO27_g8539 [Xylaria grammica]|uniref:Uncharacterized protein n=1 Tax=Xylaria grammica TaxID=363999 RepID=A0A439CWR1_9PEZI|nr:hypothetical protein EKO27_g8539 [Xylaria grammica]